jgi:geranylgeranyl pyrophosphate synthase
MQKPPTYDLDQSLKKGTRKPMEHGPSFNDVDLWIHRCRLKLVENLADAPASAILKAYFERGKMLRARLLLASAGAVGGHLERAACAAEAIELLHGASLLHDDIVDEADQRRGLPAIHKQVGVGVALTLGDYLLLRSFTALLRCRSFEAAERLQQVLEAFSFYGQECCRGQVDELDSEIRSEACYFSMARGKTGSLFALSAYAGGILGEGGADEIEALRAFGSHFGTLFQIFDDVKELLGNPDAIGKPVGRSLAQGRPLYPLICFNEHASERARADYLRLRQRDASRTEIASMLAREGIFNMVRARHQAHIATALAKLSILPASSALDSLTALANQCGASLIAELSNLEI